MALRLPKSARLAPIVVAAAVAAAPGTARAADTFPPDASTTGHGVDELYRLATGLTGAAFAVVVAILVWCVVAYRARPGRRADYATGETRRARLVTALFAAAVFVGLDVVLAVKDHAVWAEMYGEGDPPPGAGALEVQGLAKQFEWMFRYPGRDGRFGTEDDLRSDALVIPDDRPTVVRLRSIDVIHSFFLPNFRTKQDAVPGMTTTSVVRPRPGATGEYEIVCAELCGLGHYRMRGRLFVRSRSDFEAWQEEGERDLARYGPATEGEEFWSQYDRRGPSPRAAEEGR
jgi:cytochrome c oxidase subunit 2